MHPSIFEMEQNLAPDDLEYMKMAMLKHEEIFKQQVYELHRLYRVQKLLMRAPQHKIYKNEHPSRVPNEKRHMKNSLHDMERPSKMLDNFNQDDDAIDLTLGLGNCYSSKRNDSKKVSPKGQLTSDSVMSFSSSSSGSSNHSKKACIRGRNDAEYQEQLPQLDRTMLEQQPPWLLQVLSLNMT